MTLRPSFLLFMFSSKCICRRVPINSTLKTPAFFSISTLGTTCQDLERTHADEAIVERGCRLCSVQGLCIQQHDVHAKPSGLSRSQFSFFPSQLVFRLPRSGADWAMSFDACTDILWHLHFLIPSCSPSCSASAVIPESFIMNPFGLRIEIFQVTGACQTCPNRKAPREFAFCIRQLPMQ
jgi:hypothetical protein